jgi:hypothetical protein
MKRRDQNASLWAIPAPRGRQLLRRLGFGGVAVIVTVIAGLSLIEQVTPPSASSACGDARPLLDDGCGRDAGASGVASLRPIRVIDPDISFATATTEAVPPESSAPAVVPATIAVEPEPVREPSARPAPSTDGSGRVATVDHGQPSIPISDEELTFKAGAMHRSGGAVAAKADEAAKPQTPPQKRARAAKSQRAVTQTYELPDGRRVTVHRGHRDDDADGRRLRAAEAGRRYGGSFGAIDGERRGSWGFGGLY